MWGPQAYHSLTSTYSRVALRQGLLIPGAASDHKGLNDGLYGQLGTPGALIICQSPQPIPSQGYQFILVEIYEPQTGDVFLIYPCCETGLTVGPVEIELVCITTPDEFRINIKRNGELLATADQTAAVGSDLYDWWIYAFLCTVQNPPMVKAGVTAISPYAWADDCDAGLGRYSGLGHNNAENGAYFDNFTVGELYAYREVLPDLECVDCFCRCLDYFPKRTLTGTVTNTTSRALCLEGLTIDFTWYWDSGTFRWDGVLHVPYGAGTIDLPYSLRCGLSDNNDPSWPGKNFTLTMDGTVCCAGNVGGCAGDQYQATVDSTCVPLNLVFGPFHLIWTDPSCYACYPPYTGPTDGDYYIEITE